MPKNKAEKLQKLVAHNKAIYGGSKVGTLKKTEVRDAYEENLNDFATEVVLTREGKFKDHYGRAIPAHDVSITDAIGYHFGIFAPNQINGVSLNAKQRKLYVIQQFLRQNDVAMGVDTLSSLAQRFGNSNLTTANVQQLMVKHGQFAVNNTSQIDGDYRFLIPELILSAIRLDYEADGLFNQWIASTTNISSDEIKMPQILRGNAVPRIIGEAESIPFGTVKFGQKKAGVRKIGVGFKITDELMDKSSLDMLFRFLGEVGTDMAIGTDVEAFNVLMNGEQADGSESAPVVGVDSTGDFSFKDIRRVTGRGKRLKRNYGRVVTGENDGIDLSLLPEFKGFNGSAVLAKMESILGVPDALKNDIWSMPENQVLFVDAANAMTQLKYKGMKTETRRNPQNQEEEIFVSNHIGFAITRRDARVILDSSKDFATNGFPPYMDIDARINNAFKHKNQ